MVNLIEATCTRFSWTGEVELSKKNLLAWAKICFPKSTGGSNVININVWNEAAIYKLLCNLYGKKDKLWVQWAHIYYGKSREIWEVEAKQESWMLQKILKIKRHIEQDGINLKELERMETFSIKRLY